MAESSVRFVSNLATLLKIEGAYGVDAAPTGAANALQLVDVTINPMAGNEIDRGLLKPFMGHQGVILTGNHMTLQGSVELVGSGAAGTPPPFGPLLRCCGMAEEIEAGVSVSYAPRSGSFEAATLYYNLDGVRHIGLGARGTWTLSLTPSQIARLTVSLTALSGTISDAALPAVDLTDFIDPVPVNNANTTMTLHGWDSIAESLSLDYGQTVEPRMLIGEESVKISARKATGTAVVQATSLATKNWFSLASAHTRGALHVQHGTVAGNIVEIDAPKVQIGRPSQGATQNIANYSLPLMLCPDAGNDELALTFR